MHLKRPRVTTQLPDDYTRITNPERLRPLHDFALQFVAELVNEYDVIESDRFELVPVIMREFDYARPPITLTPNAADEAPFSIAFTTFPGLMVRCGRFFHEPFPVCGCDHCAANLEDEIERLRRILGPVIAGDFAEEVTLPFVGNAYLKWELGRIDGPFGMSGGGTGVPRECARALRLSGVKRIQWQKWTRRK